MRAKKVPQAAGARRRAVTARKRRNRQEIALAVTTSEKERTPVGAVLEGNY